MSLKDFGSEESHLAGLLLLRQSVVRPSYVTSVGLHPNVAWAMVHAANVKPGELVLDTWT